MSCKDCFHYEACKGTYSEVRENPLYEFDGEMYADSGCETFKDKNRVVELPFIAMIEQSIKDGKFNKKKSTQKFNGINAVVYIDKSKWGIPLIDICGEIPYNPEEAKNRIEALKGRK